MNFESYILNLEIEIQLWCVGEFVLKECWVIVLFFDVVVLKLDVRVVVL